MKKMNKKELRKTTAGADWLLVRNDGNLGSIGIFASAQDAVDYMQANDLAGEYHLRRRRSLVAV